MILEGPILITGASGFVGRHLLQELGTRGVEAVGLSSRQCDLTDREATLDCFADTAGVRHIVHLASFQAAGDFPARHPGLQLDVNSRLHLNVLEAWRRVHPQARLTAVGTSCAYTDSDRPLEEATYMDGAVHGSVYAYAMTKRLLHTGLRAYGDQYGLSGSFLIPATMFGEFDDFHERTAHVCGALINRFSRAAREGAPTVEVWGSGRAVRDLMDVKEFVRVLLALLPVMDRETLNIGPGRGTSIRDLATMIGEATGYTGRIAFDSSRYEGVLTKVIDTSRLEGKYRLNVSADHLPGLRRTADWYGRNWMDYQDREKFGAPAACV